MLECYHIFTEKSFDLLKKIYGAKSARKLICIQYSSCIMESVPSVNILKKDLAFVHWYFFIAWSLSQLLYDCCKLDVSWEEWGCVAGNWQAWHKIAKPSIILRYLVMIHGRSHVDAWVFRGIPNFFWTIKNISKYVHMYRLCALNFLLSELEISPTRQPRTQVHSSLIWCQFNQSTTNPLSGPLLDLIGLAHLRSWFSIKWAQAGWW